MPSTDVMMAEANQSHRRELRQFGLVTGGVVGLLFGLALPWFFGHDYPMWPWFAAAGLIIPAGLMPAVLGPVRRAWLAFGHALGWLNTRIILGLLFYVIILPVGVVRRLASRDPMARQFDGSAESYRIPSAKPDPKHMERPF